jgi:beta-galactosidase
LSATSRDAANPGWPGIAGAGGLVYGADYNPDQWPQETWVEDARLMREAHVNLVSVGIFSWARLELAPERYELEWLARSLDLMHANGICVDLGTPTAAPPPWLVELHPEILPVTAEGARYRSGSRRHYCPHVPAYREAAARIVRVLGERFGDHPAVVMWHVDNEYGCHVGECFCEQSRAAFRSWLERRYGTVDAVNRAWGSGAWGQTYTSWNQIEPPRPMPTFPNPGHDVDWQRFCSDSWIECFLEQKAILREVTPNLPVTTNFMGFHRAIDYWKLAAAEDLVSQDTYPETSDPDWQIEAAMVCDLTRSLGRGRPWLLMEQAVAYATWRERNSTKRPGVMRLASLQSVARGADGIMFFQWRTAPSGAEMHTTGLIAHSGTDNRQWREAVLLGAELERLAELRASRVRARTAILFDWANWWALETEGKLDSAVRLMPLVRAFYGALFRLGVTVDFAAPGADLSGYSLVVAPHLYMIDDDSAENVRRYVHGGGTLLMSFFSGLVDPNVRALPGPCPVPFSELLGLHIEEFAPFAGDMSNRLRTADGRSFECSVWADVVRVGDAAPMATFESDFYAGLPGVTRHGYGNGTAMYLATLPHEAGLKWLLAGACEAAGVAPHPGARAEIEIVERTDGVKSWRFVFNYSDAEVEVPLGEPGVDLTSGRSVAGSIRVPPVGVAIVRAQ